MCETEVAKVLGWRAMSILYTVILELVYLFRGSLEQEGYFVEEIAQQEETSIAPSSKSTARSGT